jgi:hypothetical protein
MDEMFPGVFKVLPTKPLPSKCITFFVRRAEGNLLFPCFSSSVTIHAHFDQFAALGGLSRQLLGDSHFKTPHCTVMRWPAGSVRRCIAANRRRRM